MYKIPLTYSKNIIVLLIGVAMSLGLGLSNIWFLLLYGVGFAFIFLTRTKYIYLPIVMIVLSIVLFIINFTFTNGVVGSFAAGSEFVYLIILIELGCTVAYFVLNLLLLKGKIGNKKGVKLADKK